jgi:hypothetical protein
MKPEKIKAPTKIDVYMNDATWCDSYLSEDKFTYVIPSYKINRLKKMAAANQVMLQLLRELDDDLKLMEHTSIGEGSLFHNRIKEVLDECK